MEDLKMQQLEMKSKISEMKISLNEVNRKKTAEGKISELKIL